MKAKYVSNWINRNIEAGMSQTEMARLFKCAHSSISNLKKMKYKNAPMVIQAYSIIKSIEQTKELPVKTDWPKGIKAPTGEVENDIHTLKMQVKEYVNEIQNHAEKLNDLKKANDNCIDHSGQVFKTLSKRIEELRADITGRIQDKAIQCTNIDKKFNHHSERIEGLKDEVFAKLGNALIELDELKGEISELREQLQNSLQPMDDWKMKVMEYGHRLAKLESVYYYPEPKTGLIRKFWRWLW